MWTSLLLTYVMRILNFYASYLPFVLQPALRSGAIDTVTRRQIIMNGPLRLVTGVPPPFGTISRIPIFLDDVEPNETWGTNRTGEL
jgi:hypothetical protein